MPSTQRGSEFVEILGGIHPLSTSGANSSGWIKADTHNRYLVNIHLGVITATGTDNAKLEQANTGAGGGAKDITNKAITQVADTGDNHWWKIDLKPDELDIANGFLWFRVTVTAAVAATLVEATVLGVDPKRKKVAEGSAIVTQTVN